MAALPNPISCHYGIFRISHHASPGSAEGCDTPEEPAPPPAPRVLVPGTLQSIFISGKFCQDARYAAQQQALKAALDAWFGEVRKARWSNTADVKRLPDYA